MKKAPPKDFLDNVDSQHVTLINPDNPQMVTFKGKEKVKNETAANKENSSTQECETISTEEDEDLSEMDGEISSIHLLWGHLGNDFQRHSTNIKTPTYFSITRDNDAILISCHCGVIVLDNSEYWEFYPSDEAKQKELEKEINSIREAANEEKET